MTNDRINAFQELLSAQLIRDFPWREGATPWGVMVSEFMLQQTQTARVVSYFERWIERWPTPESLEAASLEDALCEWSGLGYNRRCRYLCECARILTHYHHGTVPDRPEHLERLPGIGHYTAGAIAAFAYNYPALFIETNIRAALLYFFFPEQEAVPDSALYPILEQAINRNDPRHWYWALMDYGAALKKTVENPGRKSSHYSRQSPFAGSFRQIRGALIKSLVSYGPSTLSELSERTGIVESSVYKALNVLQKEQFVAESGEQYSIQKKPE
ncbi:endonuclease III [Spirochaetia bacterium]|nr:endonuclease III [Spirochaetia bacterium]GHU31437.1 endonuclease III [Spirochaetia bacterium]